MALYKIYTPKPIKGLFFNKLALKGLFYAFKGYIMAIMSNLKGFYVGKGIVWTLYRHSLDIIYGDF